MTKTVTFEFRGEYENASGEPYEVDIDQEARIVREDVADLIFDTDWDSEDQYASTVDRITRSLIQKEARHG